MTENDPVPTESDAEPTATNDAVADDTDRSIPVTVDDGADRSDLNAEARNWRLKYRAADTELAVANARITELNRLQAEDILARKLADVSDAWINGADLADMLNDDGLVDKDAVLAFAEELVSRKPHLAARLRPVGAPSSAMTSDDRIPTSNTEVGWQDVISGKAG